MDISYAQAVDITHGTLQNIRKNSCPLTYLYNTYNFFNTFWKNRMKVQGGKEIEREIALVDEGNAGLKNRWADDTHNVKNITKKYKVDWRFAKGNYSYNWPEMDLNNGPEKIFDVLQLKYNNALREMSDAIYLACILSPTSSSDEDNPHGIMSWLPYGTDDATGSWCGTSGHYNDSSGTSFDVGGISASTYSRWASYYGDHNGDLDDSLLSQLDTATRKLHFEGPQFPEKIPGPSNQKFSLYSNDNVIKSVNLLYAKSDDQMGYRIGAHFGRPSFKGMTFEYVDILDTARTYQYGTDPIIGINHDLIYPVVHSGWDFKVHKPTKRDDNHLVLTGYIDLQFAIICDNRRRAGFLLNQQ